MRLTSSIGTRKIVRRLLACGRLRYGSGDALETGQRNLHRGIHFGWLVRRFDWPDRPEDTVRPGKAARALYRE